MTTTPATLRCSIHDTERENNSYIGKMTKRQKDDAPDRAADDPKSDDGEPDTPIVPEAGEGPIPPVAGDPRPPIGN